jgi:hypothetical protein
LRNTSVRSTLATKLKTWWWLAHVKASSPGF